MCEYLQEARLRCVSVESRSGAARLNMKPSFIVISLIKIIVFYHGLEKAKNLQIFGRVLFACLMKSKL